MHTAQTSHSRSRAGYVILALLLIPAACSKATQPESTVDTTGPTSLYDWTTAIRQCTEQAGAKIQTLPGDTFKVLPGSGMSEDALSQIIQDCRQKAGPMPAPPTDPATAAKLYDQLIKEADCLKGLGYPISDPPSRQTFVDTFPSGTYWDPWRQLPATIDPAKMASAQQACKTSFYDAK